MLLFGILENKTIFSLPSHPRKLVFSCATKIYITGRKMEHSSSSSRRRRLVHKINAIS